MNPAQPVRSNRLWEALCKLKRTCPAQRSWNLIAVVQLLRHVWLFATQWTAARQASLSFTISRSLLKLMSIESVMPSNHLILWTLMLGKIEGRRRRGQQKMRWLELHSSRQILPYRNVDPEFTYPSISWRGPESEFLFFEISSFLRHHVKAQSCPTLCNPMDYIAHQIPLSMEFSRQEY